MIIFGNERMEFMSNFIILLERQQESRLSSIKFLLHIKQVLSSTEINAPFFSYFPVCILNE